MHAPSTSCVSWLAHANRPAREIHNRLVWVLFFFFFFCRFANFGVFRRNGRKWPLQIHSPHFLSSMGDRSDDSGPALLLLTFARKRSRLESGEDGQPQDYPTCANPDCQQVCRWSAEHQAHYQHCGSPHCAWLSHIKIWEAHRLSITPPPEASPPPPVDAGR